MLAAHPPLTKLPPNPHQNTLPPPQPIFPLGLILPAPQHLQTPLPPIHPLALRQRHQIANTNRSPHNLPQRTHYRHRPSEARLGITRETTQREHCASEYTDENRGDGVGVYDRQRGHGGEGPGGDEEDDGGI